MIDTQAVKQFIVISPAAINDNAAFTTNEIDTIGYDYCDIYMMFGAMDIAMAVMKLQESDTTGTGFTDITGGDFSVLPATLPSATADNTIFCVHVNLNGKRKRFLDLSATAGDGAAGTYAAAWAVLSRAEALPNSASTRGLNQELYV